ncbi:MAG: hypothetical protein LBK47_02135 [Prevotellaceae bacterium]|nr:hypothetical protein [Prevotellaceae bacterium]
MNLAPEAVTLYANKISRALRLLGVLFFALAFVQYLVGSPEFTLLALFIPIVSLLIYLLYFRKILTGKVPIVSIILGILVFVVLVVFIGFSYIETSVIVDNDKLKIAGFYGETIPLNQISEVFVADTLPSIGLRTNGISTGTISKGYFFSKSLRKNVKLLLHSNAKPYIYLVYADDKYIIINFRKQEKTQQVNSQLKRIIVNE